MATELHTDAEDLRFSGRKAKEPGRPGHWFSRGERELSDAEISAIKEIFDKRPAEFQKQNSRRVPKGVR